METKIEKTKNYTGNKAIPGVRERILGLIPAAHLFVEGFAGSGGIAKIVYSSGGQVLLIEKDALQCSQLRLHAPELKVIEADFLSWYRDNENTLPEKTVIFLDPPYLHSTRSRGADLYNCELTPRDHVAILNTVISSRHKFIIIHPITDLYTQSLKYWDFTQISIRYHKKTSFEGIWTNYDLDTPLFNYLACCKSNTQRQQVKRELSRLHAKFDQMTIAKRSFFLNSLIARYE